MNKIAFSVFSYTGNTHSVAQKLKRKLETNNIRSDYYRLKVKGGFDPNKDRGKDFEFKELPDLKSYDTIIFGGPVQAFSLNPVTKQYLQGLESLKGKKIMLLTTEFLPFAWMGGNRAIRTMKKLTEAKGGEVIGSGIINWSRKTREEQIRQVVKKLSKLIK